MTAILPFFLTVLAKIVYGGNYYADQLLATMQDAVIYPGSEEGPAKIQFSDLGDFDDVQTSLAKEGFQDTGLFCVKRGAFIVYQKAFLESETGSDFSIVSGQGRCALPFQIQSAQPIGPIDSPRKDSVTFFTRPNFGSVAMPVARATTYSDFVTAESTFKSFITIGRTSWTIRTAKGQQFCVRPRSEDKTDDDLEKSDICMLPEISSSEFNMTGINVIQVFPGCDRGEYNATVELSYCVYWGGSPKLGQSDSLLTDGDQLEKRGLFRSAAGTKSATSCDVIDPTPEDSQYRNLLYYFKVRLERVKDSRYVMDYPGPTNLKWRLELLDLIWQIAKITIPEEIISTSFLDNVQEYYTGMLALAWQRRGENTTAGNSGVDIENIAGLVTEYDYRGLLVATRDCLEGRTESENVARWKEWFEMEGDKVEDKIRPALRREKVRNLVAEMTWIVINMVMGICHKHYRYTRNFYQTYVQFVNYVYLNPMREYEWLQPLDVNIQRFFLGGDLETKYNQLAFWTGNILHEANDLVPILRPETG